MKKILPILCLITFFSCSQKQVIPKCVQTHISFDYASDHKTIIPINTQNFWTYVDSVFDPETGVLISASTSLIKISDVYQIDGLTYFDFNQLFPPMTVVDDTLFSVSLTQDVNANTCYTLNKGFYPVTDTVSTGPAGQVAYFDTTTVKTAAGNFSGNVIFEDGVTLRYVFHPGIGLIRNTIYVNGGILRRSMTLKDYSVQD